MLYVAQKDTLAFTPDGIYSWFMEANVPCELPDHMIPALVALGARPYSGSASTPVVDAGRVAQLVAASRKLLAENNPEVLTRDGTVKVAALDAAVGFTSTKAERDAVEAELEA